MSFEIKANFFSFFFFSWIGLPLSKCRDSWARMSHISSTPTQETESRTWFHDSSPTLVHCGPSETFSIKKFEPCKMESAHSPRFSFRRTIWRREIFVCHCHSVSHFAKLWRFRRRLKPGAKNPWHHLVREKESFFTWNYFDSCLELSTNYDIFVNSMTDSVEKEENYSCEKFVKSLYNFIHSFYYLHM